MKRATLITIWLTLAIIVITFIQTVPYIKLLVKNDVSGDYATLFNVTRTALAALIELAIFILGLMALTSTDPELRDRTYTLFRYMYVAGAVANYPLVIYSRITYAKYLYTASWYSFVTVFVNILSIILLILLISNKPQKQVERVNLQEYDMVAFTSTGHRFLHYILDALFLLPLTLLVFQWMYSGHNDAWLIQLIYGGSYLLYCFFSEAVFGQTFGKMITRSCVVSDGVPLTPGRVFLRTLARLIPFDGLSFLFGAKWHDRASSTAVVYIDSWEKAFDNPETTEATA
ncbi:RDD family protein [Longitalea luteola]|uniref:RDD family protein n=1 Tax=Longitalea luteola TaxID=2812563 RepID=UPI001A975983|nr:RDD family protein [Longitalea luteola]